MSPLRRLAISRPQSEAARDQQVEVSPLLPIPQGGCESCGVINEDVHDPAGEDCNATRAAARNSLAIDLARVS